MCGCLCCGDRAEGRVRVSHFSVLGLLISPVARPAGDLHPPLRPAPRHLSLGGSQDQPLVHGDQCKMNMHGSKFSQNFVGEMGRCWSNG